jgi:hypothetical protein
MPIGRQPDQELKLLGLTICLGASDDTTNNRLGQGPISCDGPRDWMRPE